MTSAPWKTSPYTFSADPDVLHEISIPYRDGYLAEGWRSRHGHVQGVEVYYRSDGRLDVSGVSDLSLRAGIVSDVRRSYLIKEYLHRRENRRHTLKNWQRLIEPYTMRRKDGTVSVSYGDLRVRLGSQLLTDNLYRCKVTVDGHGNVEVSDCLPGLDTLIERVVRDTGVSGGSLPR